MRPNSVHFSGVKKLETILCGILLYYPDTPICQGTGFTIYLNNCIFFKYSSYLFLIPYSAKKEAFENISLYLHVPNAEPKYL